MDTGQELAPRVAPHPMTSTAAVLGRVAEIRGKATRYDTAVADLRRRCQCPPPGHPQCGPGFRFVLGDVTGGGVVGTSKVTNCGECAQRCRDNARCLSYECSASDGVCNLNDRADPDWGAHRDYAMCSRIT